MVMRYLGNEGNEPTHPVRPRPVAA
jgi:hypothetical protein